MASTPQLLGPFDAIWARLPDDDRTTFADMFVPQYEAQKARMDCFAPFDCQWQTDYYDFLTHVIDTATPYLTAPPAP